MSAMLPEGFLLVRRDFPDRALADVAGATRLTLEQSLGRVALSANLRHRIGGIVEREFPLDWDAAGNLVTPFAPPQRVLGA